MSLIFYTHIQWDRAHGSFATCGLWIASLIRFVAQSEVI
jgi:hypothetical protein